MKKIKSFNLLSASLLIFNISNSQIVISGFEANPAGTDSPYEYVQLKATQTIDFSVTSYSVVFANNGTATSNGWIAGGNITYGFNLTSGIVAAGDIFYVGGSGRLINGLGSTDISTALWIRWINTGNTAGDGFGNASSSGIMGNGTSNADGIAVFSCPVGLLTAVTVPVDAVFYGTSVGTAKPPSGGYMMPENDHYSTSQGTYGNGTNTYYFPDAGSSYNYIKLAGTFNTTTGLWETPRTGTQLVLSSTSTLSDIATAITIFSEGNDTIPPQVASVNIISPNSVKIIFSEAVNSVSALDTSNYNGLGTILSVSLSGTDTVNLFTAVPFNAGMSNTIAISGITDLTGNMMDGPYIFSFIFNNSIGELIINEIMYIDPSSGIDSLEFIELYNNSSDTIELGGYHFSSGINYEFPPSAIAGGEYIVLSEYPAVVDPFFGINSVGWTSGSLEFSGEQLTVLNTTGDTIDYVIYDDVAPWPEQLSGTVRSLILSCPSLDNNEPANWSYSSNPAGIFQGVNIYADPGCTNNINPGTPDNGLFISEYLEGSSNTKAIELYNPGLSPVNLSSYAIWKITNGGDWSEGQSNAVILSGILAPHDVYVIGHSGSDTLIISIFDTTGTTATVFNGNDAIALARNTGGIWLITDKLGDEGPSAPVPSNFNIAGITGATADHTIIRKSWVTQGNTDWTTSAGNTTENSEWIVFPMNTYTFLGSHPHIFPDYSDVTFEVNMSHYQSLGLFDPSTGYVDISGTFNNWGGIIMNDPDSNLIYTVTLSQVEVDTAIEFKFRINGSNDPLTVEFPSGYYRSYTVAGGENYRIYWYNDIAGNVTIHDIQYTQVTSGNSPVKGLEVTTKGVVTAQCTDAGYFIQDGTGIWNGIFVRDLSNIPSSGDSVTVTGLVDEPNNMTEIINISSFTINSISNVIPPAACITTSQVSLNEGYEGVIVKVHQALCTSGASLSGEWTVNDGSGSCLIDDMVSVFLPVLGNTYNITGPVFYSSGNYLIEPRCSTDIINVSDSSVVHTINMPSGWSIFSTYVDPGVTDFDSLFQPVLANIIIIKSGQGQVFWPQYTINQIGNIIAGQGYQVKTSSALPVTFSGNAIMPESTLLNIPSGWSIIGYLRQSEGLITQMLGSIIPSIGLVKNGAGLVYWPYYNINGIGNMFPGQGYQIYMFSTATLCYPENNISCEKLTNNEPEPFHFGIPCNTGNNMTLGINIHDLFHSLKSPFIELGVFDGQGMLVGSGVATNPFIAVTVWGDDFTTPFKDGLYEDELFEIAVWDPVAEKETMLCVQSWATGNGNYNTNKISIAEKLLLSGNNNELHPVFQNPVSDIAEIRFFTDQPGIVELSIHDIAGRTASIIFSGYLTYGAHIIPLNLDKSDNGIYLLTISTSYSTISGKLIILK